MIKGEEVLEFEIENRAGPYVFLERPPGENPRYQVRIERPWKNYKWDYWERGKALVHFMSLTAAGDNRVEAPKKEATRGGMSEKKKDYLKYGYCHEGFEPPRKKWD
jgi:hypothetical protein